MNLWQAVVLGLVQGLTEFLPVSSSGHLVLAEAAMGVQPPGVFVEVALHVATLGSVLVVYGRRLWAVARGVVWDHPGERRYAALLVAATIPAGIVGVALGEPIERAFESLRFVAVAFLVTGLALWSTRRLRGTAVAPGGPGAVAVGAAQAVAILPGISRSGATVSVALWLGLAPERAAEFSFLMAVPVIVGAAVLEAPEAVAGMRHVGLTPLLVSCAVALVSGVWAIRFLVALLRRGRFYAFAPYCWAIGALTLGFALWRG